MPTEDPVFIGRRAELDQLKRGLATVAGERRASTVLISGDAGVGKSRLLREFMPIAETAGAYVLFGSCDEFLGGSMPYVPLMEALEGFERRHTSAGANRLGGPSYGLLTTLFYGNEPVDNSTLGTPHQVFLAVRRMLDHIGQGAPVVLVLEDLHWADEATLGLVSALARARPEGRSVLLVCSHRPAAELVRGTALRSMLANADFVRRVKQIALPAFTAPELHEFLTVLTGAEVSEATVRRCLDWSDGIAFQAEQLHVSGTLDRPDSPLPPMLNEVMLAQFTDSPPAAKKVLRVAAVAGRRMSHRLLETVSGIGGAVLNDALQECVDRRVLVPDPTRGVYRFRHALLREAIYQDTVASSREELHVRMAEALHADPRLSVAEQATADAEEAYHWDRAGRLPEAFASAVRAGHAAERTRAFASAEMQFGRALELWDRVEDAQARAGLPRARLLAAAADAARWSGHVQQAVAHVQAALAVVDSIADPDLAGELYERLGNHLWEDEQRAESARAYEHAARLLADRPASAAKARVLAAQALTSLRAGAHEKGSAEAERALGMARAAKARAEEGRALNLSGLALGLLGQSDRADDQLCEAIDIANEVHNLEDLFRGYSNRCLVLENASKLAKAAQVAREGLAEARQLDLHDTRQGTVLANNASAVLFRLGEWAEAEAIIGEITSGRQTRERLYPRLTLAEIHVARGRFEPARALLSSMSSVHEVTDLRFIGPFHAIQAELALWQGRLDVAARQIWAGVVAVRVGEDAPEMLRLCAIGLRCAADRAAHERTAARPGSLPRQRSDDAAAYGDRLATAAADIVRDRARTAEVEQLTRLCAAERQRILGTDKPVVWSRVAAGWDQLEQPYRAAYARWREAEAAFADPGHRRPGQALRAAHDTALALGADPLRNRVEHLARQAGIDLTVRAEPETLPYGLTPAEFEILQLLAEGLSTGGIAQQRKTRPRTVDTQLGRIYRKLEVTSRGEAMAKAYKEKLLDE